MKTAVKRETREAPQTTPEGADAVMGADPSAAARTRTCVGCGEKVGLFEGGAEAGAPLVRLVLGPQGEIAVDAAGGGFGRGAHVHASAACLAGAAARGLPRAAKRSSLIVMVPAAAAVIADLGEGGGAAEAPDEAVPMRVDTLARAIGAAMDRRLAGLVGSAVRARAVAVGTDAVKGACHRGDAHLLVVACDAAAAADLGEVRQAVSEGRAVAWGSKSLLGALTRKRGPVGVVAISSEGIAGAVKEAAQIVDLCQMVASSKPPPRRGAGPTAASQQARPRGVQPSGRGGSMSGGTVKSLGQSRSQG